MRAVRTPDEIHHAMVNAQNAAITTQELLDRLEERGALPDVLHATRYVVLDARLRAIECALELLLAERARGG